MRFFTISALMPERPLFIQLQSDLHLRAFNNRGVNKIVLLYHYDALARDFVVRKRNASLLVENSSISLFPALLQGLGAGAGFCDKKWVQCTPMFNYSSLSGSMWFSSRAFLQAFIELAKPSKMIGCRIKLFQICEWNWETTRRRTWNCWRRLWPTKMRIERG